MKVVKILKIVFGWIITVASVIAIVFYCWKGLDARGRAVVTGYTVMVSKSVDGSLLSEDNINNNLEIEYPELKGRNLEDLDLNKMEQFIGSMDGVESSEVYFSYDSLYSNPQATIFISIKQKEPLLRVIGEKDLFVMKDGSFVKRRPGYSADILVARGYINEELMVNDLLVLVKYINEHKPWRALIGEIIVDKKGDIILRSKIDGPRVVIGDVKDLDTKFRNLEAFYNNIMPTKEVGEISEISVKYSSQVLIK